MPDTSGRFHWILGLARICLYAALFFVALALVFSTAMAVIMATGTMQFIHVAPFLLLIVCLLIGVLVLFIAYGLVKVLVSMEHSLANSSSRLNRIETLLQDQGESSKELLELLSLSDKAKSLLYRDREIEAFREAIHEDVIRQDYQTAEALIDTIEQSFGYADEAARLREELAQSRKATFEEKIDAAVARIQSFIDRHEWARAARESQRIVRLFPDNPKIAGLHARIQSARTAHKRDLLQRYGEAVRKNDVDESISALKELDLYLTPQEAAALAESARGVFKARLHQLGVQFAIRVTDRQWSDAISVGEEIIREYPNSRMAQEVHEKMDVLHSYAAAAEAGEDQPAGPGDQP